MKHTELPWSKCGQIGFESEDHVVGVCYVTYQKNNKPLKEREDIAEANAAFIVKACNEHYKQKTINNRLFDALNKIATINAMDYEYQAWAMQVIKEVEAIKEAE